MSKKQKNKKFIIFYIVAGSTVSCGPRFPASLHLNLIRAWRHDAFLSLSRQKTIWLANWRKYIYYI